MSSHYLHQRVTHPQNYSNLKPYRFKNGEEGDFAIMTNGNYIQLYRVLHNALAFYSRYTFAANIVKIQVLPSRYHTSDYIWILDSMGRFACWRPDQGYQFACNNILKEYPSEQILSPSTIKEELPICSGSISIFDSNNTLGTIFYSMGNSIATLQFVISKQGLFIDEPHIIQFSPYCKRVRYIGWIKTHRTNVSLLGVIIEQSDSNTILNVYKLQKDVGFHKFEVDWILPKSNLLQFYSPVQNQVLILTYDQIALHGYRKAQPIRCFRTKGNYGQGFYLGNGLYGHIGRQLVVFSKDILRTYSDFRFNNQSLFATGGFVECACLTNFGPQRSVIGIITHRYQIYLLSVQEKLCTMHLHSSIMPIISSLHQVQNHKNNFVAVGSYSEQEHQVLFVKAVQSSMISREQLMPFTIDKIIAVFGGSYIILVSKEANVVMRLNKNNQYSLYFYLPSGYIITIASSILIMEDGIYEIDYQTQSFCRFIQLQVVLAQIIEDLVYFMDVQGTVWSWNTNTEEPVQIESDHFGDYCWGTTFMTKILICANIEQTNKLKLISENQISQISIKGNALVSCLSSISPKRNKESLRHISLKQQILVGFNDGCIHVYNQSGQFIKEYKLLSNNFVFFQRLLDRQILVLTAAKQYILKISQQETVISEIQLSTKEVNIQTVAFLSKSKSLLFLEGQNSYKNRILRHCEIEQGEERLFKTITSITKVTDISKSLPFVLVRQSNLIYADIDNVYIYSLITKSITVIRQHQLLHICGLEFVSLGILIVGIDIQDRQVAFVYSQWLDLLFKTFLSVKKPLKSIKVIANTNKFFIWASTNTSLHQIQASGQIRMLAGCNSQLQGYQMNYNGQDHLLMLNDPYRCLSFLNYQNSFTQIARYVSPYEVINAAFIGEDVVISDQRGHLSILNLEREPHSINWFSLQKHSSLDLSQHPTAFCHTTEALFFATSNGGISKIKQIKRRDFELFRSLEYSRALTQGENRGFCHSQWRKSNPANKLVDGIYAISSITSQQSVKRQELSSQERSRIIYILLE